MYYVARCYICSDSFNCKETMANLTTVFIASPYQSSSLPDHGRGDLFPVSRVAYRGGARRQRHEPHDFPRQIPHLRRRVHPGSIPAGSLPALFLPGGRAFQGGFLYLFEPESQRA